VKPQWFKTMLLSLAMLVSAGGAGYAHADLYGFIDEQGVAHFANAQVDDRYVLFMKASDPSTATSIPSTPTQRAALAPRLASESPESKRLLGYLVNHPNLPKVQPLIHAAATRHGVDPALVKAVIAAESGFNAQALSPKGAVGLMQVIPDTGARFGVVADAKRTVEQKLYDPAINIPTGVRYLSQLSRMFPERIDLVLAAYNAGEGAVQRYRNQIPPYPETQNYVKTVLQFYQFYNPVAGLQTAQTRGEGNRVRVVLGARRTMQMIE
jgi:soluble lytic murein transglycosylase-like protein